MIFYLSGDVYNGQFLDDKMTGKAQYIYKVDSKVYEGNFFEGSPYGEGIMKSQHFVYKGYFKSGIFDGKGCLEDLLMNQKYEGDFLDGKKHGYGVLVDLNTMQLYQGGFFNNKK